MIRRGFWLALGAAGGVMGYRRAVRLGRHAASGALARDAIRAAREARRFTRDVREGMDLYSARHPGGEAPRLHTRGASRHRAVTSNDGTAKDDHDAVG